jgi:hypothetical protein
MVNNRRRSPAPPRAKSPAARPRAKSPAARPRAASPAARPNTRAASRAAPPPPPKTTLLEWSVWLALVLCQGGELAAGFIRGVVKGLEWGVNIDRRVWLVLGLALLGYTVQNHKPPPAREYVHAKAEQVVDLPVTPPMVITHVSSWGDVSPDFFEKSG